MTLVYELYYWPALPGRGEILRLILEDAGVPYRDVARIEGTEAVLSARAGELGGVVPFAPPVLRVDDLVLSQTPVIARYLGERLGLAPADEAGRLHAQQHFLGWSDFMLEIHDTHHPIAVGWTYAQQRSAARDRAAFFRADRLPQWLRHFEAVLEGSGSGVHVGSTITYPDLMAYFVLGGLEHAFPNAFAAHTATIPKLQQLRARVASRPNLVAYSNSERRLPFTLDGIFRHYPELDA